MDNMYVLILSQLVHWISSTTDSSKGRPMLGLLYIGLGERTILQGLKSEKTFTYY